MNLNSANIGSEMETDVIVRTPMGDKALSAPVTVHLELTSGCVEKCRHCYNFWRYDASKPESITREKLDFVLDEIIKNNVFHVILTGGEPLLNYDQLLYAVEKLTEANLSVSCNSNLILATKEKMTKLHKAGLPHILTTINSYDKATNDMIVSTPGALKKIINGIKVTVDSGIQISVNMVISQLNKNHIYKTGELAAKLDAKKFHGTRTVPPHLNDKNLEKEFWIEKNDAEIILRDLMRVKNDFGMAVGSLITLPYCFLEDPKMFEVLYQHGCPAGIKMMSVNVNGDAHACVHESENYGNIFDIGLHGVWKNMNKWRSGELFPEECMACSLFDICNAGCRMVAKAYKEFNGLDNLHVGWKNKEEPNIDKITPDVIASVEKNRFSVPKSLRFRKENRAYVTDTFGSEVVLVKDKTAKILLDYYDGGSVFSLNDVGEENKMNLAYLLKYNLVEVAK